MVLSGGPGILKEGQPRDISKQFLLSINGTTIVLTFSILLRCISTGRRGLALLRAKNASQLTTFDVYILIRTCSQFRLLQARRYWYYNQKSVPKKHHKISFIINFILFLMKSFYDLSLLSRLVRDTTFKPEVPA